MSYLCYTAPNHVSTCPLESFSEDTKQANISFEYQEVYICLYINCLQSKHTLLLQKLPSLISGLYKKYRTCPEITRTIPYPRLNTCSLLFTIYFKVFVKFTPASSHKRISPVSSIDIIFSSITPDTVIPHFTPRGRYI